MSKDLEELLKLAAQVTESSAPEAPKPKKITNKEDFINFVSDLNLADGRSKMKSIYVYRAYVDYSDNPMPYSTFMFYCNSYFHVENKKIHINNYIYQLSTKAKNAKKRRNEIKEKATEKEIIQASQTEISSTDAGDESQD